MTFLRVNFENLKVFMFEKLESMLPGFLPLSLPHSTCMHVQLHVVTFPFPYTRPYSYSSSFSLAGSCRMLPIPHSYTLQGYVVLHVGEHEIDHILVTQRDVEVTPNPNEVMSYQFVDHDDFN